MDDAVYKPVGNGTEVGLLKFLQDADISIHILINKKHGKILMTSPHSPETKRSAVAILNPDRPDTVTIYIKGAPE
jgi:magnesium-transporting ATPase (P-type)